MLLSLAMRNVALIESLELPFADGFHAMTGETGAGKSIVVDAVNLVLGGRADRDIIRTGTDKASVEACFTLPEALRPWLSAHELEAEDGTVTLYRELSRNGRNTCRICGAPVPVSLLREAAAFLMDVHGQHEAQFLMDPQYHRSFLDAAGDGAHQKLLVEVADACAAFLACHRRFARLVRENSQKEFRMSQLRRELDELEKAKLQPGEEETLAAEKERHKRLEKISGGLLAAHSLLSAGEGVAVLQAFREAVDALKSVEAFDEDCAALAARASAAYYELEEISYDLAALAEKSDYDPSRAAFVEDRLDLIRRLERRYGPSLSEVLAARDAMQEEYDHYESLEKQIRELEMQDRQLLGQYRTLARRLTASRRELAERFEERIMEQLRDLGMEKTVFRVAFEEKAGGRSAMPQPTGDDTLQFMISPNPGEPLKPLSRIASGGELSRLMLALKSIEAEHGGIDCMVFDEIDTGISGRMAQVVGEKMSRIARHSQVICVTHLPQIAAMADRQILVEKRVENGRTLTSVHLLSQEERVLELARMLGGAGGVDESACQHARHMLEAARKQDISS